MFSIFKRSRRKRAWNKGKLMGQLDCPHFASTQCASVYFNRHLGLQVEGYYRLISIGYILNIAFGRQGPEVRILSPRPTFPSSIHRVSVSSLEHCFLPHCSLPEFCRNSAELLRQASKPSLASAHRLSQPRTTAVINPAHCSEW